jgi:N-acetylglutamate synthase-like GNAT family acetyltransferase
MLSKRRSRCREPFIIRTPQTDSEWNTVKKLLQDYRSEFDDQTCFTSFEQEMENIKQYYADEDKLKLIAVDETTNSIIGCVALRSFSPGVAEMKRLYVMPSFRGHKIGNQLAEAIIEKALKKDFTRWSWTLCMKCWLHNNYITAWDFV